MTISTCCGCISLRTGTIIIGTLSFYKMHYALQLGSFCALVSLCIQSAGLKSVYDHSDPSQVVLIALCKALFAGLITYCAITLMVSTLLIIGIVQKVSHYVFPFICMEYTNFVFSLIVSIAYMTYLHIVLLAPVYFSFIFLAVVGMSLCLKYYFLMVVYTYYQELYIKNLGLPSDYPEKA